MKMALEIVNAINSVVPSRLMLEVAATNIKNKERGEKHGRKDPAIHGRTGG
ncbi:hypothetical protein D3C74_507130 [compost metagenome]